MRGDGYSADPVSVCLPPQVPERQLDSVLLGEKQGLELAAGCVALALPWGCSELWELLGTSENAEAFLFCFKYNLIFSNYKRNA